MPSRLPGLAAAALTTAVAVLYLVVIFDEGIETNDGTVVTFVAGSLALGAALGAAGALARDPYWRRLSFGIAAGVIAVIAFLGMFSIGMLLVPSLLLLMFALGRG